MKNVYIIIIFFFWKWMCTHAFHTMPKITFYAIYWKYIILQVEDPEQNPKSSHPRITTILTSQQAILFSKNGSLIHVDSRPAPRLSIELQQSNIYIYIWLAPTYISIELQQSNYRYDRPRYTLSRATAIIPLSLHISQ